MYSEKVMDHFNNPRNVGEIENPSGVGTVGNAKCGDIMRIYLDIDDNGIIQEAKFKTFGCGAAVATSSMATELVKGKTIPILRAIKELTQENIFYTFDQGKTYDFNTADKLNTLLINALVFTGELKEIEEYDVDFDHQFLETEKYDAKPTYKKFLGYRPGVYVIGDKIVYIENSDGNTNVRFYQADTHKRFFALLEFQNIRVNRFRADCGSCLKEIVSEIEKHCKHFYICANRCSSLYNDIFALRGWKTEEINGIQFELNSILVEKWEGKCYRLVI